MTAKTPAGVSRPVMPVDTGARKIQPSAAWNVTCWLLIDTIAMMGAAAGRGAVISVGRAACTGEAAASVGGAAVSAAVAASVAIPAQAQRRSILARAGPPATRTRVHRADTSRLVIPFLG